MKLYTNKSQTAKLIELGYFRPALSYKPPFGGRDEIIRNPFSIGELLSILPSTVGKVYDLHIEYSVTKWHVAYYWIGNGGEYYIKYKFSACELIDTLYMMILRLKEEGVI